MNEELFNEASKSNILSKQLVDQLQESMTYSKDLLHQLDHRSPQAPESPHRTRRQDQKMRPPA